MNWVSIQSIKSNARWVFTVFSLLLFVGCMPKGEIKSELNSVSLVSADVAYAWVQYDERRSASARAIIASAGATCPIIAVDSAKVSMNVRTIPAAYTGFTTAVTVCEYPLPRTVTSVVIDNSGTPIKLPLANGASSTSLVVGDTGCRLKGRFDQWCKGSSLDKGMWGFPALSVSAASEPKPNFILHVGDYLYRETTKSDGSTCDPENASRGWVNCGDNWAAWEDDFFAPANIKNVMGNALLKRAPWIFVRGNHEDCNRAWQGYFLFFYPGAAPSSCDDVIDPYPINLSGLDVYMVDSSNSDSVSAQASFTTVYQDLAASNNITWLTTHEPTSSLAPAYANSNLVQRQQLKWLHVGHVHRFQHSMASSAQQAETVTGGSGTALDSCAGIPVCSSANSGDCCYGQVSSSDAGQYSYMTVTAAPPGSHWTAKLHDVNGKVLHVFTVR